MLHAARSLIFKFKFPDTLYSSPNTPISLFYQVLLFFIIIRYFKYSLKNNKQTNNKRKKKKGVWTAKHSERFQSYKVINPRLPKEGGGGVVTTT